MSLRNLIKAQIQKLAAPYIDARVAEVEERLKQRVADFESGLAARLDETLRQVVALENKQLSLRNHKLYYPNNIVADSIQGEYMRSSNCIARDFYHPDFTEFCRLGQMDIVLHRKMWEHAFVYDRLKKYGALTAGNRGLVFGVGHEFMPSLFARLGIDITATDSPHEGGWTGEHSTSLEQLFFGNLIDRATFERRVRFETCDMNAIPDHLVDYDFCWSSCAFEHLGSLQHGCDFIINSVEKTLKIGGVACHTTELNMSSDVETLEHPKISIYRKSDLQRLCNTLEERGHIVEPLRIEPGDLLPDYLIDVPPFSNDPHLKLMFGEYVTTSVGIVVRRGR